MAKANGDRMDSEWVMQQAMAMRAMEQVSFHYTHQYMPSVPCSVVCVSFFCVSTISSLTCKHY